ncbi:MAG: CapA family protein [Spirochaetaceae bacterium]|nr:CapA family protein [Spirochaetaceae bacterium]MCF7948808.1 CapA family protein [Spirochaetia bacterium]MCF7950461.1 CapA family protein [Spirochaetaceae bacterium]
MYRFTFTSVLFLLLALSCSPIERQPVVLVEDETASHQLWSVLVQENPLPDGITLSTSGDSSIDTSKSQRVIAHLRIFHQKATDSVENPLADSLLLESTYYVPVVPFWDPRNNVALNRAEELPMLPVEEVMLPQKALSVDGLRIDSPEYPLVEKSFLELTWIESAGATTAAPAVVQAKDSLSRWFTRLSNRTEYTDISSPTSSSDSPELVWIGGVGDMMLQRGVQELLIRNGKAGMHTVFQDTLPVLQQQDLLIGNLEGAVTRHSEPVPKSYNFRFLPQVVPWLREAGFDYLSITNNHCYDYGSLGFLDTLHYFEEYGLLTSGAGRSPQEAYTPVEISIKGIDITVLSAAAYPQEKNGFDGRSQAQVTDSRPGIIFSGPRVLEVLRRTSSPDSIDIMVAHGGEEWHSSPSKEQQQFYRAGIDAGADLVFAHHPHVLQGMEAYKGGLIAYSLGNFIFPGMYEMPYAEESMILSAGFYGGRLLYLQPYPVNINHRLISLAPPNSPILPRFLELTRQLN